MKTDKTVLVAITVVILSIVMAVKAWSLHLPDSKPQNTISTTPDLGENTLMVAFPDLPHLRIMRPKNGAPPVHMEVGDCLSVEINKQTAQICGAE